MDRITISAVARPVSLAISDSCDSVTMTVSNGSQGKSWTLGTGLKVENGVLMVDTAQTVEQDNSLPVTSAAVYTQVGNINALLGGI